jgi:serine/threonine protein kinase
VISASTARGAIYGADTILPALAPGVWRIVRASDDTVLARATFSAGRHSDAVRVQLRAWSDAIRTANQPSLLAPRLLGPSAGDPTLEYPAPVRVGWDGLPSYVPPDTAVALVARLANALDALHAAGVVHGALGMASLWWMPEDRLCLPDCALGHVLDGLMVPPAIGAHYLAPEVLRGGSLEPASDQYSLAVIAYELLTGRPIVPPTSVEGITAIEPIVVDSTRPLYAGAPAYRYDVLRRALAGTPAARFASCTAFADALAGNADALPHSLPTVHARLTSIRWTPRRIAALTGVALLAGAAGALAITDIRQPTVTQVQRAIAQLPRPDSIDVLRPSARGGGSPDASTNAEAQDRTSSAGTLERDDDMRSERSTESTVSASRTPARGGAPADDERSSVTVVEQAWAGQPGDPLPRPLPVERDPSAGLAWVTIEAPRGSRLFLDGVRLTTPNGALSVTAGTHDLDVVTSAQQTFRRRFTARAGDTVQVIVRP